MPLCPGSGSTECPAGPFPCHAVGAGKAYLDYDPKAEYEKVLQAAQGLLAPSGFHKSKGNFYRLWEEMCIRDRPMVSPPYLCRFSGPALQPGQRGGERVGRKVIGELQSEPGVSASA